MSRKEWEVEFIKFIIKRGMSLGFAKFLSRIVPYYEEGISPEKAAELEFNKLYK